MVSVLKAAYFQLFGFFFFSVLGPCAMLVSALPLSYTPSPVFLSKTVYFEVIKDSQEIAKKFTKKSHKHFPIFS
jgi:hypothetical protein